MRALLKTPRVPCGESKHGLRPVRMRKERIIPAFHLRTRKPASAEESCPPKTSAMSS